MNEQQPFEAIKNRDEAVREYWSARNLGHYWTIKSGEIFKR